MWFALDVEYALAARDDQLAEQLHGDHREQPRPPVDLRHPRRGPWAAALAARPAVPTWPEPF